MNSAVQGGLKAAGVKNPSQYRIPEYTELMLELDIPIEQKFGVPSALIGADVSSTLAAPGLGPGDIFSLPTLDFLFGYTSKTNEGVIGNTFNIFTKMAVGTYSDVDMYKFLKATMPPVVLAEVERRFSGVSGQAMFSVLPGFERAPSPPKGTPITEGRGRFYEFRNGRYIVANPYKKMYGQIERDIGGFWARYLGGRSFEESIILKSIWQSTKISMNHKDKIDAIQNALNSDKTLVEILKQKTGGGMADITGGSETASALGITDSDISFMLRNQRFLSGLSKTKTKTTTKEKVAKKDQKKYDDYNALRKAARKALPTSRGAINPNNLTELKKVLDAQKPKTKKK